MLKTKRYARTVNNGDSPLIVCTSDTGIRDVASELRMCPPIWKKVRGSVVTMMSLLGGRTPFFSAGTIVRNRGYTLAIHPRNMHQEQTKANCISVRVTGFGNAVRMVLEDVFDMMEVMYQKAQRP